MPRIASACSSASARSVGELDAAGLAAAADLDLGLDHHRVAELLGGLDGLVHGRRVAARPARARRAWRRAACPGIRGGPCQVDRMLRPLRRTGARTLSKRPNATSQRRQVRHVRLLRHPDRLGDRRLRRIPEGGRPGRLHDRPRRADPALHRDPARDPARLLRALRRGAAPHGRARRGRAGLGPRALALELPAQQRAAPGRRSARPTPSSSASPRSTRSASSRTSTTSCSGATRRHFRADFDLVVTAQQVRSLQARPGPLQGVRAPDRGR